MMDRRFVFECIHPLAVQNGGSVGVFLLGSLYVICYYRRWIWSL